MVATAYPDTSHATTASSGFTPSDMTIYYSDSGGTITGEDSQGDHVVITIDTRRRSVTSFSLPKIEFDSAVLPFFEFIESLGVLPEYPEPRIRPPPDEAYNPIAPIRGPPSGPWLFDPGDDQ